MKYFTAAPRRLVSGAFSLLRLRSSWTRYFTADCACFLVSVSLLKATEAQKQDQSGILAQIFLFCGKLPAGIFHEALFISRMPCAVKCRASKCRANEATSFASVLFDAGGDHHH
jgi:hypothetical protein